MAVMLAVAAVVADQSTSPKEKKKWYQSVTLLFYQQTKGLIGYPDLHHQHFTIVLNFEHVQSHVIVFHYSPFSNPHATHIQKEYHQSRAINSDLQHPSMNNKRTLTFTNQFEIVCTG